MEMTIAQLAEQIGAELAGDGSAQITGVGPLEAAGPAEISFIKDREHYGVTRTLLTEAKDIPQLKTSNAAAFIVGRQIKGLSKPQLIVRNVDAGLIKALELFSPRRKAAARGIDPTAKVGQNVETGEGVCIGEWVVIGDNVKIGADTTISAGCKVGENSRLGKGCRLDSNVVIYHNCVIGDNVIIQANSTIGSTGFGYSFIDGSHRLIPHIGGVVIEDFVEIGANCCIDRAKFGNTTIGAGTKIDNLVQIAHNVVIGKCCLIAGQAGIGGSSKLGDGVVLGGQGGVSDHVELGDGVMVGAASLVFRNIAAGRQVFGTPARERAEAMRIVGATTRLPKLVEQLKQLTERVEKLEAAKDNKK